MWFHLTAIDQQNQTRKFSFQIDQLERGFNLLHQIVAGGEKLTLAQLVDEQTVIDLPIDSFNSSSSEEQLADFEREWQSILKKPDLTAEGFNMALLEVANMQLVYCENQVIRLEQLVSRVEATLLHVERMTIPTEARQVLKNNYKKTQSLCRVQLNKAITNHQHLVGLIHRLS